MSTLVVSDLNDYDHLAQNVLFVFFLIFSSSKKKLQKRIHNKSVSWSIYLHFL